MDWEMVGALAEAVGAGGVVVTLIFLAVQVRHSRQATEANTRSLEAGHELAKAQAHQARTAMWLAHHIPVASSDIPRIWAGLLEGGTDLEESGSALSLEDRTRLAEGFNSMQRLVNNSLYQYEHGFLAYDEYRADVGAVWVLSPIAKAMGYEWDRRLDAAMRREFGDHP